WFLVWDEAEGNARRGFGRNGRFRLPGRELEDIHRWARANPFSRDIFGLTPERRRAGMFQQKRLIERQFCQFGMFFSVNFANLFIKTWQGDASVLVVQIRDQFAQHMDRVLNHAAVLAGMNILTGTKD